MPSLTAVSEPPRPPQLLHEVPARLAHAARPQLPPPRPRRQVGADVEELVDVVGRLAVVPPHCRPHRPERARSAPITASCRPELKRWTSARASTEAACRS